MLIYLNYLLKISIHLLQEKAKILHEQIGFNLIRTFRNRFHSFDEPLNLVHSYTTKIPGTNSRNIIKKL